MHFQNERKVAFLGNPVRDSLGEGFCCSVQAMDNFVASPLAHQAYGVRVDLYQEYRRGPA